MEQITVKHMVAYCHKFIADLQSQIEKGEGEDWMVDCIKMETAIVAQLLKTEKAEAPVRPITFNEDYIGELIKQRVILTQEVTDLETLCDNRGPRLVEQHYEDKLHKRKEELAWTLAALRSAKKNHLQFLQHRAESLRAELNSGLVELAEEQELRHLLYDVDKKILSIETELKSI